MAVVSVILKKEHCQTHMLTNNNLYIVRIGYKTKTDVKQAVRKKINKKRYY